MNDLEKIIKRLVRERACHVKDLCELTGLDTDDIYNLIQKARDEYRVKIEKIGDDRFTISSNMILLCEKDIIRYVDHEESCLIEEKVDVKGVITTTQDYATDNCPINGNVYICIAEYQTAGHGKYGRPWASPYASNLNMSLSCMLDSAENSIDGLTLAIGVAVLHSLQELGVPEKDLGLKWPNDIWVNDSKIAGILTKRIIRKPNGKHPVIIGIGVNGNMANKVKKSEIDQDWTDLFSVLEREIDRNMLAGIVLNNVLKIVRNYDHTSFKKYKDEWIKYDIFKNAEIALIDKDGDTIIQGIENGINDKGELLIKTKSGMKSINYGEIDGQKVRKIAPPAMHF